MDKLTLPDFKTPFQFYQSGGLRLKGRQHFESLPTDMLGPFELSKGDKIRIEEGPNHSDVRWYKFDGESWSYMTNEDIEEHLRNA